MAGLALTLACGGGGGGGGTPTSAVKLVYTDPPADSSTWQLVADPLSTETNLILDLMAPASASGQGVTLVLGITSGKVTWSQMSNGHYAASVYSDAVVNVASVQGSALRIVVAQTSESPAVTYGTAPVLQVSLEMASGAVSGTIPLTVSNAGHLGTQPTPTVITVAVGTLEAQ